MSLFATTTKLTRYLVQAEGRNDEIRKKVFEGLKGNAMPEIQGEYETLITGWVPFETPYRPDFVTQSFTYGEDMVFGLRIDQKKLPAKVIKRELEIAIENKKKEQGRDFISRSEKLELKEQVIDILMSKTPFNTDIHHVCWNPNTCEVLLFTTTKAAQELFETLFFKSFACKLIPIFPFSLAYYKLSSLTAREKENLETLTPSGVK